MEFFADVPPDALRGAVFTIMLAVSVAWCCGLSPFGTMLAVGLITRWQSHFRPPGGLTLLAGSIPLYAAASAYAIEVVMSKVPSLALRWNRWTGPIRVIAGGALAWMALGSIDAVDARVILAFIGCALALACHAARSGIVIAATEAGTAMIAIPIAGIVADCLLFSALLPFLRLPVIAIITVGVMVSAALMACLVAGPEVRRAAWQVLSPLGKAERRVDAIQAPEAP